MWMALIYVLILLKMLICLNFDKDFYKRFHCTMMVLSSYSKQFSINYFAIGGNRQHYNLC